MSINDLTIGQAREVNAIQRDKSPEGAQDYGLVVANVIGRFVYVADMVIQDGWIHLTNVKNIRYWASRENGLGGLAENGVIEGDVIDLWPDQLIPYDKIGPFMRANPKHWAKELWTKPFGQ